MHQALAAAGVAPPVAVQRELARRATNNARRNLANVAEEKRLQRVMTEAGTAFLFFKGNTLAMLAYGSLALKTSIDIDMLIPGADVEQVSGILRTLGYRRLSPDPALSVANAQRFMDVFKESVWSRPDGGILLEPHIALSRNRTLIPDIGLDSPQQLVRVADGVVLPTLARDELFSYLCVHGSAHQWRRLKWLADVAALVGPDAAEAERLYHAAIKLGAERCPALALLLCHQLLGLPLPTRLLERLQSDRAVVRLAALSLRLLNDNGRDPDFDLRPGNLLRIFWARFQISPRWQYVVAEIDRQARMPSADRYLAWPAWTRLGPRLISLPGRWLAHFRRPRAAQATKVDNRL